MPHPRPSIRMRMTGVFAACSLAAGPALAEKTDIIVLLNGDRITGEVKELAYGQLKFSTDDMGTLYIEWDKIAELTTRQLLQVELSDGGRLYGQATQAGSTVQAIRLDTGKTGEAVEVPTSSIVRMATIDRGKWYDRLDGSVNIGYNFTAASDVEVLSVAAEVGSRNQKRKWNVSLDAQLTDQQVGDSSQSASLVSTLERFMRNRYYYEGSLAFSRNQQLGLDLRTLVGATFGRYLHQSPGREWRAGAGLAASAEDGTDGSRRESLEAVLNTSLRLFRFDSPETNVNLNLTLLPSLTESGRLRGEGSLELRREIVSDLFFSITLNDSYDNQPAEGAATNDWSVVTSLGYTF